MIYEVRKSVTVSTRIRQLIPFCTLPNSFSDPHFSIVLPCKSKSLKRYFPMKILNKTLYAFLIWPMCGTCSVFQPFLFAFLADSRNVSEGIYDRSCSHMFHLKFFFFVRRHACYPSVLHSAVKLSKEHYKFRRHKYFETQWECTSGHTDISLMNHVILLNRFIRFWYVSLHLTPTIFQ
jgi:hypothetical protein